MASSHLIINHTIKSLHLVNTFMFPSTWDYWLPTETIWVPPQEYPDADVSACFSRLCSFPGNSLYLLIGPGSSLSFHLEHAESTPKRLAAIATAPQSTSLLVKPCSLHHSFVFLRAVANKMPCMEISQNLPRDPKYETTVNLLDLEEKEFNDVAENMTRIMF